MLSELSHRASARYDSCAVCRGGDQNNSSVQKYFLYLQNVYTDEMNGETKMDMTDECSLYTINFATARPIAFTSLHRHVYTIPRSVSYCYHLVATPRTAQVCFSQFLLDTLP